MFSKSQILSAALTATLLFSSQVAQAQDNDNSSLSIGVTGGTLGIGPEVTYRISDTIGIRGNATFLKIGADIDSDDLTYDADLSLQSAGVMVDIYPFGSNFRISGGLRVNGNEATGTASPNAGGNFEIDSVTYTATEIGTLSARTDINDIAPALTVGFGGRRSRGLYFGAEAGVLLQGSVQIAPLTFTGLCAGPAANRPANCATLTNSLEAERLDVNEDIKGYKLYPILQLSLGYRF